MVIFIPGEKKSCFERTVRLAPDDAKVENPAAHTVCGHGRQSFDPDYADAALDFDSALFIGGESGQTQAADPDLARDQGSARMEVEAVAAQVLGDTLGRVVAKAERPPHG